MSGGDDSTQKLIIAGAVVALTMVGGVLAWKLLSRPSSGDAAATVTTTLPATKRPARPKRAADTHTIEPVIDVPAMTTSSWIAFEDVKQYLAFKHPETIHIEKNVQHPVCVYRLVDSAQPAESEEEGTAIIVEFTTVALNSKDYFERSKQMLHMMQMMMGGSGFAILDEKQTKVGDLDAFEIEYTQLIQKPTGQQVHMKIYNLMYTVDNRAICVNYANNVDRYDPTFVKDIISTLSIPEQPADPCYLIEYVLPEHNLVVPFPSSQYGVDVENNRELVTIVHTGGQDEKATRIVVSRAESGTSIQDIAAQWGDKIKKANPATSVQQEEVTLANSTPAVKISFADPTDRKGVLFVFYQGDLPLVATGFAADDAKLNQVQNAIMNIRTEPQDNGRSQPFIHYRNTDHGFSMDVDPSLRVLQADFGETIVTFLTDIDPTAEQEPEDITETTVLVRSGSYDAQSMITAMLDEIEHMRQSGSEVEVLDQKKITMGGLAGFHISIVTHMRPEQMQMQMQMQETIDMVYHITCVVKGGQLISLKSATQEQAFSKVKARLDAMAQSFKFI